MANTDNADKFLRLTCFSLRNDGILLWSHYADRHRGFVVGFDKEVLLRGIPKDGHFHVRYRSNRPAVANILDLNQARTRRLAVDVMRTKSLEWAYEEEYRVVWPVEKLKQRPGDPGSHYCPFDPRLVCQVILGAKSSDRLQRSVRKILKAPHYRHVQLFMAAAHKSRFEIEVKNLKP